MSEDLRWKYRLQRLARGSAAAQTGPDESAEEDGAGDTAPPPSIRLMTPEEVAIRMKVRGWRAEGFVVDAVEAAIERGGQEAEAAVIAFADQVERLREYIEAAKATGAPEAAVSEVVALLHDPANLLRAGSLLDRLKALASAPSKPGEEGATKRVLETGGEERAEQACADEDRRRQLRSELEQWRGAGYVVDRLERVIHKDISFALKEFRRFRRDVQRLEDLRRALFDMDTKDHAEKAARIESMLYDVDRITEARMELLDLRRLLRRSKRGVPSESAPATPVPQGGGLGFKRPGRSEKGKRQRPDEPPAGAEPAAEAGMGEFAALEAPARGEAAVTRLLEPPPIGVRRDTRLDETKSFDRFVVLATNSIAQAAAAAVAASPGITYNPFLIIGESGTGKTHLLHAVGNEMVARGWVKPDAVVYAPLENLILDLTEAEEAGSRLRSIQRYMRGSILLLDDLQYLQNKTDIMDHLRELVEDYVEKELQVVATSDRPLREVEGLDEGLRRILLSGLVTEIRYPTLGTRTDFLQSIAQERDMEVSRDVLELISEIAGTNIEMLESYLIGLSNHASAAGLPMTMELARTYLNSVLPKEEEKEALRHELHLSEGVADRLVNLAPQFKAGRAYLVSETKPYLSLLIGAYASLSGRPTVILTRRNPRQLRTEMGLGKADLLWITESEGDGHIKPSPEGLSARIEGFMEGNDDAVVVLDDLNGLLTLIGSPNLLRLLRQGRDLASIRGALLICSCQTKGLDQADLKAMERELGRAVDLER